MGEVVRLDTLRVLPVARKALIVAEPKFSPHEIILQAADRSMADKVETWARGFLYDLSRFNGKLTSPQRKDLLAVVSIIEKHPPQP